MNTYKATLFASVVLLLSACGGSGGSSSAPELIDQRFEALGIVKSVVQDSDTGLIWQRCALGQQWDPDEETCGDSPTLRTWQDSLTQTTPQGFRLPRREELATLIHCSSGSPEVMELEGDIHSCQGSFTPPTISTAAFPEASAMAYWTATERDQDTAWATDFADGNINAYQTKTTSLPQRLVYDPAPQASGDPIASRYQPLEQDQSLIQDTHTGLVWQRCALGQRWNNAAQQCEESAERLNWQAAMDLATDYSFRLPSKDELKTLLYCSSGDPYHIGQENDDDLCFGGSTPTIVQDAFPNTPSATFWTATPMPDNENQAYGVGFGYGGLSTSNPKTVSYHVRLIRVD